MLSNKIAKSLLNICLANVRTVLQHIMQPRNRLGLWVVADSSRNTGHMLDVRTASLIDLIRMGAVCQFLRTFD